MKQTLYPGPSTFAVPISRTIHFVAALASQVRTMSLTLSQPQLLDRVRFVTLWAKDFVKFVALRGHSRIGVLGLVRPVFATSGKASNINNRLTRELLHLYPEAPRILRCSLGLAVDALDVQDIVCYHHRIFL